MKRLLVAAVLLGIVGGLIGAAASGRMSADLGPAGVSLEWSPAPSGTTVLDFPPLGDVSAHTHWGPSRLKVTLERIELEALRQFVNEAQDARSETIDQLTEQIKRVILRFTTRLLLVSALGGVLLWGIIALVVGGRPTPTSLAVSALAGMVTMAALTGAARYTYDTDGFRSPVYNGALEAVPWLVETVDQGLVKVEELDQRLRALSRNLYRMYQRVEALEPPVTLENADVTLLHVSDFHNHPSAVGIVSEVARSFAVDFIVNTGDLTDFGTVLETELVDGLSKINVPQFFVSGNHETPSVLSRIESLANITLLDGKTAEKSGLLFAGLGDPGAYRDSAESMTPTEVRDHAAALNERLMTMERVPDILAVHNFRVAQGVTPGVVPAILFGHSHTAGVQFRDGTAYVNAGTTGGAGLRGIEANQSVPITLAVLYVKRTPIGSNNPARFRSRVLAVDILRLSPFAGGFTLERHLAPAINAAPGDGVGREPHGV